MSGKAEGHNPERPMAGSYPPVMKLPWSPRLWGLQAILVS